MGRWLVLDAAKKQRAFVVIPLHLSRFLSLKTLKICMYVCMYVCMYGLNLA